LFIFFSSNSGHRAGVPEVHQAQVLPWMACAGQVPDSIAMRMQWQTGQSGNQEVFESVRTAEVRS